MRGKKTTGNEKGIILIIALMLLLALTIIGISSVSTTSYETIISGNERLANTAFYSAEAGIQVGLNQIPEVTPISKTKIGPLTSDTYYSGTVTGIGLAHSVGNDQTWSYRRYQVNAAGESTGANREIEIQARYGPFPTGTNYNN